MRNDTIRIAADRRNMNYTMACRGNNWTKHNGSDAATNRFADRNTKCRYLKKDRCPDIVCSKGRNMTEYTFAAVVVDRMFAGSYSSA